MRTQSHWFLFVDIGHLFLVQVLFFDQVGVLVRILKRVLVTANWRWPREVLSDLVRGERVQILVMHSQLRLLCRKVPDWGESRVRDALHD